jgi:2-oxo-3-(phosphooxy)propyl 3-oxoalkanoate synthase
VSDTAADGGLRHERTVPRGLVHKEAIEQVLLTDGRRLAEDRFAVAAHLPRSHMLFGDSVVGHHDATLLGEAFRQAVIYVTHRFLGVPAATHFVMGRTTLELEDPEAGRVLFWPQGLEMTIEARGLNHWRDGSLRDYEALLEARVDGHPLLVGSGVVATLPPRRYAAVRGKGRARSDTLPRPAREPGDLHPGVGRRDRRNRLLGGFGITGEGFAAALVPDLDHPVFFDHPQDHLPGSMLVEALRQVAIASAAAARGWDPERLLLTRFSVEFTRFAELDRGVECSAVVAPGGDTAVLEAALEQDGEPVARARIALRPV